MTPALTFVHRGNNGSPVMYCLDSLACWSRVGQCDGDAFRGPREDCRAESVPPEIRVAGRAALLASIRETVP